MIEYFKVFKELDGLDRQKKELQIKANDQKLRLKNTQDKINGRQEDLMDLEKELKELSFDLTNLENQLSQVQQKLENKTSQKNQVFTEQHIASLDKEISTYQENLSALENETFKVMEKKEDLQDNIEQTKTFIQGASNSLVEITEEVNEACEKLRLKIDILTERSAHQLTTLPQNFKTKILSLLGLNLRSTVLTTIKDKSCHYCRSALASQLINEVEDKHTLKACVSCKRIFIPSASSY